MNAFHLSVIHYADTFSGRLPGYSSCDIDALGRRFVSSGPTWADSLMALRDKLVCLVGLKPSTHKVVTATPDASLGGDPADIGTTRTVNSPIPAPIQPGDRLGLFHVYAKTPHALLLGADDSHLNFRVILRFDQQGNDRSDDTPPDNHPDGHIARIPVMTPSFSVTTQVQFNNSLGRFYFTLIKPFHRMILRATVRGMGHSHAHNASQKQALR